MSLRSYHAKRDLKRTPEPGGSSRKKAAKALIFVVQRHKASHLHYDFRLEMDGVLKSWAVPKGPSLSPSDRRLAMMVEDHPYDYKDFHGVIPAGNYGAGIVEIWDHGTYVPVDPKHAPISEREAMSALRKGSLKVRLHGRKLKGEFALVRMKTDDAANAWLLIKHRDEHSVSGTYDSEDHTPASSPINKALKKAGAKKPVKRARRPVKADAAVPRSIRSSVGRTKLATFIQPMLARVGTGPFDDPDWLFEVKWDGYRAIAEVQKGKVSLYSRNGIVFHTRYPEITEALSKLKHDMVIDGEIVALDAEGRPRFQLLQDLSAERSALVYQVFDLLRLNGKDVTGLPLIERKELLRKALGRSGAGVVLYSDHVLERGKAFFKLTGERGMEGVIAKRADSTYQRGQRTGDWLKVKHSAGQEVVIGGYTAPRRSRQHFGALLLGVYQGKDLVYIGHTGTGFDHAALASLKKRMGPLERKTSPFSTPVKANSPAVWLKPELVGEVQFTEWTAGGQMRHPVFKGLREDKPATAVRREPVAAAVKPGVRKAAKGAKNAKKKTGTPTGKSTTVPKKASKASTHAKERTIRAGRHSVTLTNQNKLYFPKEGITKGDVVDYYHRMHTWILPHLKDRPQSLYRTPDGAGKPGFFQKDAPETIPDFVRTVPVYTEAKGGRTIDYILCNDLATLLYLANLGCIELNPWTSRVKHLDRPDHLVMDLDPSKGNTFDDVVEAALAVKVVLDRIGAEGLCKTSGSTGLHVYIPVRRYTYTELAPFAKRIMQVVNSMLPRTTTLERSLSKRSARHLYLDHLQNRQGQTLASVYSIRPRPGATVSTPLHWDEVRPGLDPKAFDIHTVPARVEQLGDLFTGVHGKGLDLARCSKRLDELL
jgi:bifunctional non-homologous end joining protein LigD